MVKAKRKHDMTENTQQRGPASADQCFIDPEIDAGALWAGVGAYFSGCGSHLGVTVGAADAHV